MALCARSPVQPRSTWQVRVPVGPVDKRLIIRGPREFRWQLLGGRRGTDPTSVSEVPLGYRYTFGGHTACPTGTPSATPTAPPGAVNANEGCPPSITLDCPVFISALLSEQRQVRLWCHSLSSLVSLLSQHVVCLSVDSSRL